MPSVTANAVAQGVTGGVANLARDLASSFARKRAAEAQAASAPSFQERLLLALAPALARQEGPVVLDEAGNPVLQAAFQQTPELASLAAISGVDPFQRGQNPLVGAVLPRLQELLGAGGGDPTSAIMEALGGAAPAQAAAPVTPTQGLPPPEVAVPRQPGDTSSFVGGGAAGFGRPTTINERIEQIQPVQREDGTFEEQPVAVEVFEALVNRLRQENPSLSVEQIRNTVRARGIVPVP